MAPRATPSDAEPAPGRLERALARHLDLIWRVLRRAGLSQADAEDTAQDVFWVLARRLQQVPEAAERSFLISTALRMASDRRRSKWSTVTLAFDGDSEQLEATAPDEAIDLRRAQLMLDAALDTLPPPERDVFVLVELEELTRAEAARALSMSEGTVASRLARARERFHAALKRLQARARRRA
ncbi:MAG: sigma-70 family RNA polymerase sigma factor [Polyangiaceae bacterium]